MIIITPSLDRFRNLFSKKEEVSLPLWMMRQAGRYLPEYRKLREAHGSFLALCRNPLIASVITLQPLTRFELDAAIIFADILLPLTCFDDIHLSFTDGYGPVVFFEKSWRSIILKGYLDPAKKLSYVAETIDRVKSQLSPNQALIGFCGSPWTVALYAWEGSSSKNFSKALDYFNRNQKEALEYLDVLTECSIDYVKLQISAGATQIMIFDSWAEICPKNLFYQAVYHYVILLIKKIKKLYPDIPVIYFPKGCTDQVLMQSEQPFDILACDSFIDMPTLQQNTNKTLQGNFDPRLLLGPPEKIKQTVEIFFEKLSKPVILNLGHGILPETPVENVHFFVKKIREQRWISWD